MWRPQTPRCSSRCSQTKIARRRSEEHTSELQSLRHLVCRLLLEKKKKKNKHSAPDGGRQCVILRQRTLQEEWPRHKRDSPYSIRLHRAHSTTTRESETVSMRHHE